MTILWPVIVGGGIGIVSTICANFVSDYLTGRRERADRARHGERVRALFKSQIAAVSEILTWQAENGGVWDIDEFDRRSEPLREMFDDSTLVLVLEPPVIERLAEALRLLDVNVRFARANRNRFNEMAAKSTSAEAKLAVFEKEQTISKASFERSHKAFRSALEALKRS